MDESYIGEIRYFAGNFAPLGWMFCEGQTLNIASNAALFNLIGITYGGDGKNTFNLPDLRARAAVGAGKGPNTSNYDLGNTAGVQEVQLTSVQIPKHIHTAMMFASSKAPSQNAPGGKLLGRGSRTAAMPTIYAADSNPLEKMDKRVLMLDLVGNSYPHNNMQPFMACNFIICLIGEYPTTD
ncbi:MAG: phage tail protein [Saprospiraceae bacterium]|nr:phage tail protein [Saprospiraceae bacterium]